MKSRTKKASRIFIGIVLAAALIAGKIPATAASVYAETEEIMQFDDPSEIFALEKDAPEELNKYPDDVYGVDTDGATPEDNTPFLLSRQDELVILARYHAYDPRYNTNYKKFFLMDNVNMDMIRQENGNRVIGGANINTAEQYTEKEAGWINSYDDLNYPQSIGVDRDGTGRKQCIATVGVKGGYVCLLVQNAKTGAAKSYQIKKESWENMPGWRIDNHMSITAGDYDGDGRDSIIVYVCGDGDNVGLWEYVPSGSDDWSGSCILNFSSILKDTRYINSTSETYRPTVSLATGDFDGDGRESFAFSAGFYNTGDNIKNGFDGKTDNLERFATCVGIYDYKNGWTSSTLQWLYDVASTSTSYSNGEYTYPVQVMHAGVIAAGDVDNDGMDEIVAAGYTGYTPSSGPNGFSRAIYDSNKRLIKASHIGDFDKVYACSVIDKTATGYARTPLSVIEMSRGIGSAWKNYVNDNFYTYNKMAVACAKINGNNAPEMVLINGSLYSFEKLSPKHIYTPDALANSDLEHPGTCTNNNEMSKVNWVRNVAVGNFNGNDAGREQFVFGFWSMEDQYSRYTSRIGVIAGVEYKDTKDKDDNISYGTTETYGCNLDSGYLNYGGGDLDEQVDAGYESYANYCNELASMADSPNNNLCAVPVAVDVDDDGILGRYRSKGYVYTDPEVLAVLQAGPYFEEIDKLGGYEDPCGTTYSFTTGYGNSTSRSDGYSFEVGIAAEVSGPGVKASLEAGYAMDYSHTFEESYSVETKTSFTADKHDLVVISRVPMLVYTYDLWNKNSSSWIKNGYTVRVPLTMRYFQLSIEEYNEFVDQYNKELPADSSYRLSKIVYGVDMPADHEGVPDNYWRSWESITGGVNLSSGKYTVMQNSGSIESAYTESAATTESEEKSQGFHFGFTLQGGGSYLVGEAWAGAYANMDFNSSSGYSTTQTVTKESVGKVQNINASAVGIDGLTSTQIKNLLKKYKFTWTFGKWTRQLMEGGAQVPFYGYVVLTDDLSRPSAVPDAADWNYTLAKGYPTALIDDFTKNLTADLTVSKVSGDNKITYDASTNCIKVAEGLDSGTYTAVFKITNGIPENNSYGVPANTLNYTFTLKVDKEFAIVQTEDLINQIPAVEILTLEDEAAVTDARAAYNALTEAQKAAISTDLLAKLEQAEARIAEIKKINQSAEKAYNLILAIPPVYELTAADEEAVLLARAAYDALPEEGKAQIPDRAVYALEDAEIRMLALTSWGGNGSEEAPFIIESEEDWNELADYVNNGYSTGGLNFLLVNDISITRMVGADIDTKFFSGTFDGGGHTIDFYADVTEEFCAPFAAARDASFKNLHTTGEIRTSRKFAAGLAAITDGFITVTNCRSSMIINSTVKGDGTHGGLIAVEQSNSGGITFSGCVFDGKLLGPDTTHCGGFLGWPNAPVEFYNCIFAPSEATFKSNNATFTRRNYNGENCYFTKPMGTVQGKQMYRAEADGIEIYFGVEMAEYDVSGISSYFTGLKYKGVFYAGEGDQIGLILIDPLGVSTQFEASAGTLTGSGTNYTLTMPAGDVILSLPCTAGHKLEKVAAKEAGCTEEGYTEHWKCRNCGAVFADQAGLTRLDPSDILIPAKGHVEYSEIVIEPLCDVEGEACIKCSVCGQELAYEPVPAAGHKWNAWEDYQDYTGTECQSRLCSVCGKEEARLNLEKNPDHVHYPEVIKPVPATCTEPGMKGYVYCGACGNFFSDESCTTIVEQESLYIPAKGHNKQILQAVPATCYSEGLTEGVVCWDCGIVFKGQEAIPKLEHQPVIIPAIPATCESDGWTEGVKCSLCGEELAEPFRTAKLEHVKVSVPYVPATCEKDGSQGGAVCYHCGAVLEQPTVIPAFGHSYKTTTTPATVSANGKIVKKCSICGKTSTTTIYKASGVKLSKTSYTYNAKVQKPSVIVKDSKGKNISTSYYTVTYSNKSSKNAGSYKVTVKFKGRYKGSKTLTYKIAQKSNSITKVTASKTLKYSTLKSKSQSFTISATVKEKAKKTFALSSVSSKAKKFISVSTGGKVTVKKGIPKGTYTIKVKITTSATKNYKKTTVTKSIKIIVK